MVLRDELRDGLVREAPLRLHPVPRLVDESRSATAAWDASGDALRDAEPVELLARTAADEGAERLVCQARGVLEPDVIQLRPWEWELCIPDAVRSAA